MDDMEKLASGDFINLTNSSVRSFGWENVTVTVKDRTLKRPTDILHDINGIVKAGEMLALMGPSGSGKTTLLNVLARRTEHIKGETHERLFINGRHTTGREFRKIGRYVEQNDSLMSALTVKETLHFAARLSLPSSVSKQDRMVRIEELLASFGLLNQANTLVGGPVQKGISGGQKRRLSVASQLITSPKILFLDEPTSGLDSTASYEVVSYIQNIARKYKLIVIASIHQPSTNTFQLFDRLLLLSQGKTVFNGLVQDVQHYFDNLGRPMPIHMNPAEFMLDLVNVDFEPNSRQASLELHKIQRSWKESPNANVIVDEILHATAETCTCEVTTQDGPSAYMVPFTLIHRSFIKSRRDLVTYWIRVGMYMGLAVMMGTVWLRLTPDQHNIQSFINAIFFGGAFMSFMAVAYIPSFHEDRSLFVKERANGLYGPTSFMVANFITGLPFLFLITVLFSAISYWLSNFEPTATGFMMWVLYLFLDLLAAESLVILISSLTNIFVVALAITAFANGLWMSVGGFLVPLVELNVFWKYAFSFMDYQRWVFQGMLVNEFKDRTYDCGRLANGDCQCMYVTDLIDQCKIDGKGVLDTYGYKTGQEGKYLCIIVGIIAGYRLFGWLALYLKRT
ncbi:putative ABC transporter [Pseudovirgaria hyperparasitica]|uniref:Putative ABC transporter n=1 Tax=Pseudovirgaria hyperparasitica TaxID=470096 RepID=A0A6A6WDZ9_9PEZI|nr:putative ABC transporter [Pseudovirgaria hyperparasitica]KAF2760409.1 putative ABC transporter [Pseudovirgaria hyperparasitica]